MHCVEPIKFCGPSYVDPIKHHDDNYSAEKFFVELDGDIWSPPEYALQKKRKSFLKMPADLY